MSAELRRPHLDAGALIGLERNDREMWARLRRMTSVRGFKPRVSAPVVAQVWRSGRQANLARALALCQIVDATDAIARRAGELCAATGTTDAVDALVVATAEALGGGAVYTSDASDISTLAAHARRPVAIVPV